MIGRLEANPMPPSRDVNFPVAIAATIALGLLSVVAIRMMWLGIYVAFGAD
jgi:hypothetical protein